MNRSFRSGLGLFAAMVLIALCVTTLTAQAQTTGTQDPLVQVLVSKGVITADDAKAISGTPAEQRDRLAQLLKQKGVISDAEYATVRGSSNAPSTTMQQVRANPATSSTTMVVPAIYTTQKSEAPKDAPKPPAPTFIPAVAPVRVLQLEPAKPGGLIPDIKLGSGANLKLYGFFKTGVVYDTSSPYGNDFPLPGFLGVDTGIGGVDTAGGAPEFHIKDRAFRFGGNFEWPDISKRVSVTGKIEADFEGNFTRVSNRNISSIRSSMPSLRLAWGRIDYKATDTTSVFLLAGQDWSPFGSSILPNMQEQTGFGIGFGNLYTREPQLRVGLAHTFSGDRKVTIGPEFAVTLPAFGTPPPFVDANCPLAQRVAVVLPSGASSFVCAGSAGVINAPGNLGDQLGYGERLGPDSSKPGVEGRIVFQFQADKAKGVAPAQIVVSGMHANQEALVPLSVLKNFVSSASLPTVLTQFPHGTSVGSDRWGASGGFSIPTRWFTISANYYRGTNLRWYFAGQIYGMFNNTLGLTPLPGSTALTTVPSIDGETSVVLGMLNGVPTVARQLAPRSQGGFVELGFPLSRIFNAEPTGRNAGWTLNVHYGYDSVFARDARREAPAGGRGIGDVAFTNLNYKMNQFVTFSIEESYYRTRAIRGVDTPFLPLGVFGTPSNQWHDFRSEFSTIFTF